MAMTPPRGASRTATCLPLVAATLLAAVAAITPASAAAADTELKWKFQPNDVLKLQFNQKNDIQTKVMGQDVANLTELDLAFTWTVKSVGADGTAEVTQTVDRAKTSIQAPGQQIDFDSEAKTDPEDPAGKALSGVYRAVVGVPYTLKVDAKGAILDVVVPEKVTTAVAATPFKALADGGSVFSAQGVKVMFAQLLPKLPPGPVKAGDDLPPVVLSVPAGPLKMELTTKGKVAAVGPTAAKVESTIDTKMTPNEGVPFEVKLNKQSGKGVYNFNPETGRLVDSTLSQSFDMTLTVNGQEISQSIKLEAVMTVKK